MYPAGQQNRKYASACSYCVVESSSKCFVYTMHTVVLEYWLVDNKICYQRLYTVI